MAEYGPVGINDDPMKKKSSFGELVDNVKEASKENAKDKAEQKEQRPKPRNIFEMLKPKSEQKEDEVATNPFLEALQGKDEDEEDETDIFGRRIKAENNTVEPEESAEVTETEPEAHDSSNTLELESGVEAPEESVQLEIEEVVEVAAGYAESTAEDAQNELNNSEPGSLEEAEAAASLVFAEAVKEQAEKDIDINEASINQAVQSAAKELDIPESTESEVADQQETEIITPENAEKDNNKEDEENNTAHSAVTPAPLINQPYGTNVINGHNNFGTNVATPNSYNATGLKTVETKTLSRRSSAKGLLVGGVVGHMVGRRRGRIKTEEKLLPVQKKLEKQVAYLHDQLTEQEMKLRRRAAIYFMQNSARSLKQLEKIQEMREKELDHTRTQEAVRASAAEQKTEVSTREAGETVVERKSGSSENIQENQERQVSPQSVEAMTIPLLLSLAETIVIGETSLRTMYERGSINQNQLRRVIKEYLNGEEIQKVLPEVMGQEFINEQAFNKMDDDQTHIVGSRDQTIVTTIQPQIDNKAVNPNIMNNSSPAESFSPAVQSILQEQKKQDSPSLLPMIVGVVILASTIAAFIFFVL